MNLSDTETVYMQFGVDGAPINNQWVCPGFAAINASRIRTYMPERCVITDMTVYSRTNPAGGVSDTYTVEINAAGTAAAVTLGAADNSGTWSGSVVISAGDFLSMIFSTTGATAAGDICVLLKILIR